MKEGVNVKKLIATFEDMAKRENLLTGRVTQKDLLIQIVGTIIHVAMENALHDMISVTLKY